MKRDGTGMRRKAPAEGKIRIDLSRLRGFAISSTSKYQIPPVDQEVPLIWLATAEIFSFVPNNAAILPLSETKIPPIYQWFAESSSMKHFEPFGEVVSWRDPRPQQSRALKWLGCGIFWLLAGTIVVARAAYFNPDIYNGFDRAIAFAQHLAAFI